MFVRMIKIFLVLGMAVCSRCVPLRAGESIVLQGQIQDKANHVAIRMARVIARRVPGRSAQAQQMLQQLTGASGRFQFVLDKAGLWRLQVIRFGYEPVQIDVWARADTTLHIELVPRPLKMSGVTVIAHKRPNWEALQQGIQPQSIFTKQDFQTVSAKDPADVLAYVPGVMIKNYGGMGGLKTISLRGGASTQTPVFINGIRYDNFQTGTTDLSTLVLDHFEEIKVFRGGNAALLGADALTGAIDLHTFQGVKRMKIRMGAVRGAYRYEALNWATSVPVAGGTAYLAGSKNRARGDHAFMTHQFGQWQRRHQRNADFQQIHLLGNFAKTYSRARVVATLLYNRGDRGVPGPVLQGREANVLARQSDRDVFLTLKNRWQWSSNLVAYSWIKYRQSALHYRDPQLPVAPGGLDAHYLNRDGLVGLELRQARSTGLAYLRFEAGLARLNGDNLAKPVGNSYQRVESVSRRFLYATFIWEKRAATWQGAGPGGILQLALRYSHYSDVSDALSPSIGFNWRPWGRPLHFRFHAAHNFRVPTFSEQYYLNFGNRAIRPERSFGVDLGGNYQAQLLGRVMLDASIFAIHTRDRIVAIPRSPVQWSTENVGRTRNFGFELLAEWRSETDRLRVSGTYARQEPRDRTPGSRTFGKLLVYMPQEIATLIIATKWPVKKHVSVRANLNLRHVSFRYHLPENDPESLLPGYTVVDANVSLHARLGRINWRLRLEMENLTDTQYEVIRNYPMPLRLWRLSLQVER